MADAGIFIGWGEPVDGREREAIEVFDEALAYYKRLEKEGAIESWEPVFLEPHGGDLAGFIILRGYEDKLAKLRATEEFQHLALRASLYGQHMGVVGAAVGEGVTKEMAFFTEQVAALA